VPPPIRIDGECIVYLQSTLLISLEGVTLKTLPTRFAHNIYMRLTKRNVDLWVVQTVHMRKLAVSFVGHSHIPVIPFFRDFTSTRSHKDNHIHLLYVSEGYPHKNHHRLFEAFEMAWKHQPNLVLHVTVSEAFASVTFDLLRYQQRGVPIENHGFLPHDDVLALYGRVDAQIYPSMTEAFGIGLIESAQAGLPILAADRPYVHELIRPSVVFDPSNIGQMTESMLEFSRSKTTTPSTLNIINQKGALLELILATPQKEY
jgi:glycosyltransferase involved in cell wall biosynthesis